MHVLVTGGAGFIGSNLIRWILTNTDDVRVTNLDALTYSGNLASLQDIATDPRYAFVHGDVRDAPLVHGLVSRVDAVIHCAAETHVDRSIRGPQVFLETNVVGTGVVLDACRHTAVERVLHISTDEVYGSIAAPSAFTEHDPLAPNSPYAASKAGADLLAHAYVHTYGYPVVVTRTTNNFGPFQHPEKALPRFITNLIDGRPIPLYGDGSNVRDWLHVEDNAAAQWLALTAGEPGTVYNVGAGNERTNLTLANRLLERFDLGPDMIEWVADRPGHDQRYAVDTSRIQALGWRPAADFDEALDATIDWYREHEDWWRPLTR